MKRDLLRGAALCVLLLTLVGCPGFLGDTKITADDILYQAESVYMSQRLDYLSYFSYNPTTKEYALLPWVNESEKEILRSRETILNEGEAAIDIYRSFVKAGKVPTIEMEQRLVTFIRHFAREGG